MKIATTFSYLLTMWRVFPYKACRRRDFEAGQDNSSGPRSAPRINRFELVTGKLVFISPLKVNLGKQTFISSKLEGIWKEGSFFPTLPRRRIRPTERLRHEREATRATQFPLWRSDNIQSMSL